jgi:hypothetical protein
MTPEAISERFEGNLKRVENLVSLYTPKGSGRVGTHETDVLRAAIVMLHASLEDFLRSYLIVSIDDFDKDTLNSYGFPNSNKRAQEKAKIGDLVEYRDQTIAEFIRASVKERIDRYETFNDIGDVKGALTKCKFDMSAFDDAQFAELVNMIKRRHQIVHKADKNEGAGGQGNHKTASLSKATVNMFIRVVRSFKDYVESMDKVV